MHEFLCGGGFTLVGVSFCYFWGCGVVFRVVVWVGRGCVFGAGCVGGCDFVVWVRGGLPA